MTNDVDAKELIVEKIANGIVVDHIPPGMALTILELLGFAKSDFTHKQNAIAVAINVRSQKRKEKRKDLLKIQNFTLSSLDEIRLGLVVPGATLNIIRDYNLVEKRTIELPKNVEGLNCPGVNCITKEHEDTKKSFDIIYLENNLPYLRCRYCEEAFLLDEFVKSL